MKRLYIAFFALAAAACTNTEYIDVDNLDPVLVMNAQMKTSEDTHYIYLSTSSRSRIRGVEGASVTVQINGGAPIQATQAPNETDYTTYSESNACPYLFDATLSPGNRVEVKAVSGELSVSSEATVPSTPEIVSVEHISDVPFTSQYSNVYGDADRWDQIKVTVRDIKGEDSYYRLGMSVEETYSSAQGDSVSVNTFWFENTGEPLLSSASGGSLIDQLTADSNSYNIFSDSSFEDGEYTLKLFCSHDNWNRFTEYQGYYDYMSGGMVGLPEGTTYKATLLVTLYSISHDQYLYIRAIGLNQYDMLFSEPVSTPSNVEGGFGFVTVDTATTFRLDF